MGARFLDPTALARLGSLSLKARTIVEGALSGQHRSPHHGSSVEFAEHKEYSPGDELKHLDWKAYGKLDRYYVKRFEEETELTAYLLLDRSGSMTYQGQGLTKLEIAAYLAGALAHLLIRQQDRVALHAFGGGRAPTIVPPRARATHLHDLLTTLETVVDGAGEGATSLHDALEWVGETARRRRSLIVVISDLLDPSVDLARHLARLAAARHDVSVIQVLDRDELAFPFRGVTRFVSLEGPANVLTDPLAVRDTYLGELRRFLEKVRKQCREAGVAWQLVPTDQPLEQGLLDFLAERAGRRGAGRRDPLAEIGNVP